MHTLAEIGMEQKRVIDSEFDALKAAVPSDASEDFQILRDAVLRVIDYWYGMASELAASGRATDRWHAEAGVRVDFHRIMELMQDEVGKRDGYVFEGDAEWPEEGGCEAASEPSIVEDAEAVVDMAMAAETAMRPRMRVGDARRMAEHLTGDAALYVISTVPGLSPIRGMFAAKGLTDGDADCLVLTDYDIEADPGALDFLADDGIDIDWTAGHGRE